MSVLKYPSVVERYFRRMYSIDIMGKPKEDVCLMFHSNKVCVITLAPSHPIVANKKKIKTVDFKVSEKLDRRNNKVTGKTKRGAQFLTYESPLCRVTCDDDDNVYVLRACFNGRMLEVNENLHNNPQLLVEKFESNGYIAIAIPTRKNDFVNGREKLINRASYLQLRFPDANIVDADREEVADSVLTETIETDNVVKNESSNDEESS